MIDELLSFTVFYCDGGCYSPEFPATNLLVDDQTVYSSAHRCQVNIILARTSALTPMAGVPFIPRKIIIKIPIKGFTSPLKEGFIFLCREAPNLEHFALFDHVSTSDLLQTPLPYVSQSASLPSSSSFSSSSSSSFGELNGEEAPSISSTAPNLPTVPPYVVNVIFFRMDRTTPIFEYSLCKPLRPCRFVLIKFLRSFGSGENVDVEYFGVVGDDYKITFPFAQLL